MYVGYAQSNILHTKYAEKTDFWAWEFEFFLVQFIRDIWFNLFREFAWFNLFAIIVLCR